MKAEYNSPNNHGQAPLHKAAYVGNLTVVQYLVEQFNVVDDIRDNHGNCIRLCRTESENELAKWIRRYASIEVHQAINVLGLEKEKQSISVLRGYEKHTFNLQKSIIPTYQAATV